MENLIYLTLAVVVVGFVAIFLLLRGRKPENDQSLVMLQQQLNELNRTVDLKMGESTKAMQRQFGVT